MRENRSKTAHRAGWLGRCRRHHNPAGSPPGWQAWHPAPPPQSGKAAHQAGSRRRRHSHDPSPPLSATRHRQGPPHTPATWQSRTPRHPHPPPPPAAGQEGAAAGVAGGGSRSAGRGVLRRSSSGNASIRIRPAQRARPAQRPPPRRLPPQRPPAQRPPPQRPPPHQRLHHILRILLLRLDLPAAQPLVGLGPEAERLWHAAAEGLGATRMHPLLFGGRKQAGAGRKARTGTRPAKQRCGACHRTVAAATLNPKPNKSACSRRRRLTLGSPTKLGAQSRPCPPLGQTCGGGAPSTEGSAGRCRRKGHSRAARRSNQAAGPVRRATLCTRGVAYDTQSATPCQAHVRVAA